MNQKQLLSISKKTFFNVLYILLGLIFLVSVLTFIIPKGSYQMDNEGMIVEGTFQFISDNNYPLWRYFIAPIEVLWHHDGLMVIMISVFLLILGGTFHVMDQTGGIHVLLKRLIIRFKHQKYVLLRLIILIFMLFGAFFGIFEESLALLPILILLSLSMGWDTMTGLSMGLLSAGFGFATAITNPFSIGIASTLAGVNILSGVLFRIIIFIIMYAILQWFIVKYAKKIEHHPEKSLTYADDLSKSKSFDIDQVLPYQPEQKIYKVFITLWIALFVGIISTGILELLFSISIPAIPLMAVIFLIGGLLSGYLIMHSIKKTLKLFFLGMLGVLPAILLILLAVSVKHIITEAMIMDTILYYLSNILSNTSQVLAILFIYLFVLVIQFFIGSASAKAFLIMPILIPLVSFIGISKELSILAFVFADGYTNVIFPTNAVLLIGLSIAQVSYSKWFRFTYKIQMITLILTIAFLWIGLLIGY